MKKIESLLNQDLSVKMPRTMKVVDRVFNFLFFGMADQTKGNGVVLSALACYCLLSCYGGILRHQHKCRLVAGFNFFTQEALSLFFYERTNNNLVYPYEFEGGNERGGNVPFYD